MFGRITLFVYGVACYLVSKRHMFFAPRLKAIVAAAVLSVLFVARNACSQSTSTEEDRIPSELAAMGKRGEVIARGREQTLVILQTENACTAWFREADPEPAEVFRSLHYEIEEHGPSYVFHMKADRGGDLFKHPWVARSTEREGRNATVVLNTNGAFFSSTSPIMEVEWRGIVPRLGGNHTLVVGPFSGNTAALQITTLLHELGHIIGRLPEDDDSWDGQSSRNTQEVLRHCRREIRAVADSSSRSSNGEHVSPLSGLSGTERVAPDRSGRLTPLPLRRESEGSRAALTRDRE
jgi:hypothetical protein